jgi:hypothetical protein
LISYTITELYPILKVKEAAPGTGGLCGSTFLNRRFKEFLTENLGGEEGWDDEILAEAMERFDSAVRYQALGKDTSYKLLNRSRNNTHQQQPARMVIQS